MNSTTIAIILFLIAGFLIYLSKRVIEKGIILSAKANYIQLSKKGEHNSFPVQTILKASDYYVKQGYIVTLDSNIMLDHPNIIAELTKSFPGKIALSNKVREELDKIKDNYKKPDQLRQLARLTLKQINEAIDERALKRISYDYEKTKQLGMDPSINDNLIVASFKIFEQNTKQKLLYITSDSNSRHSAKFEGITTIDGNWAPPTNGKSKSPQSSQKKKAFIVKTIGLALLSAGIGLWLSLMQSDITNRDANATVKVNDEVKFGYSSPVYYGDDDTYLLLDEYDNIYKGVSHEVWGGTAIIDIYEDTEGSRIFPPSVELILASWNEKKAGEKSDKLVYTLKSADGSISIIAEINNSSNYDGENDLIHLKSVNGALKFKGVNESQVLMFFQKTGRAILGDNLILEAKDLFSGEVIFTLPVAVQKQPLEEWKND